MSTATKTLEMVGFTYDGSFPLDFLRSDERISFTGDRSGSHVVITSPRGHVRFKVGDLITRRPDGSLFVTGEGQR